MAACTKTRDWDAGNRRDRELVLRARAGDEDALNELYHRYYQKFHNRARRWLWDPAFVDECAAHVVARVFEDLPSYRPDKSTFSYWANMQFRSEMIKHVRYLELDHPCVPIDESLAEEVPAPTGQMDAYLGSRLHEEVESLEPEREAAIDGVFFEGMTEKEIGEEKHMPARRVCYRLHQALGDLRKGLGDVAFTWIRPQSAFFRNYYMMASSKRNLSALLGGEEGDCS